MDKYEYKSKTDRMLELMESGAYSRAAEIADEIDWRRVRNVVMLSDVSEIYEKNGEYQRGYDILTLAYQRAEGSRKIISRLCGLALKTGNVDEAIDFYDDFMQIAPKDPNQYILRYKILRAQRAPIEQQIESLEEYKKSEYIEEWAYELAKLYQEAGMTAECLEECDDLILWFSEGQYVYKAMELKMQYKPLTPSQQEKYNKRYERFTEDTEEIPNIFAYADAKAAKEKQAEDPAMVHLAENTFENEEDNLPIMAQERRRVAKGMEELIPEEVVEEELQAAPEGMRELIPENDPVEVNTEKWDESDTGSDGSEVLLEDEEVVGKGEKNDKIETEEKVEDSEQPDEAKPPMKKKLGDTMPLDVALRKLLHPELEELKADDFQDSTAPMDFDFEDDEDSEYDLTETGAMDFDFEDDEDSEYDLTETGAMDFDFENDEDSEYDLTETGAMDFDFENNEDSEYDLTETGVMDFDFEDNEDSEFDLTETGAVDLNFDFSEMDESEESKGNEIGNTSQIKFRPVRKDYIEEDEDLADLEQVIGEIESVADIDMVSRIQREKEEAATREAEVISELEENADSDESVVEGTDVQMASRSEQEGLTDSAGGITKGDNMEMNKKTTSILPPDIQRMIDEIEGVIPPEEEKKDRGFYLKKEEQSENMGQVADDLRLDDDFDDDFGDEYFEEDEADYAEEYLGEDEADYAEEYLGEDEADYAEEYLGEDEADYVEEYLGEDEADYTEDYFAEGEDIEDAEEMCEAEDYFDEAEVIEEADEAEDYFADEDEDIEDAEEMGEVEDYFAADVDDADDDYLFSEDEAEALPDIDEEFEVNLEHSDEDDDREIPDDDEPIDIMSATTPLSRKETAKMIATGKTAPLPLDEISNALSMDTGFIVHGKYDLEMQSGIGTRAGLTEEQKKLFSYFVPVRGMSEQLVDVLEQDKNCTNRGGTSKTGNLLIIGNKGNGKTVLAVDVVKAIQKQRNNRQGKVAIVTGDSLNKKKISDIVEKLYGGALIIEKASKMNEKTVARLNKAMENDTGEMLIVLEEQRKPLDRLLSSNREFRKKFTSRLEVPIFINDELVTFGQTYAKENGYHIDEMGILALYSKIDSLQREDHAVTVAEVKEVMDDAIRHSQKASAKKLMRRVFGKNTDDSDRIFLTEKDFHI